MYRPIVIQRARKHEIDKAVQELVDRGFEVICPPVQQTFECKRFSNKDFGRRAFLENVQESKWMAKLRKVE